MPAYPAEDRLRRRPVTVCLLHFRYISALGGARSIRYTTRLELATGVASALARCRFSKSHHRTARVAPCRFSTAYFLEIGDFAPFSKCSHISGRNFPDVFSVHVYIMTPMNDEKFHENRSARFQKSGRQTHRRTDSFMYIDNKTGKHSAAHTTKPERNLEEIINSLLYNLLYVYTHRNYINITAHYHVIKLCITNLTSSSAVAD